MSTDELIMLSGVQLLIFAVVYAVWGPFLWQINSIDLVEPAQGRLRLVPKFCNLCPLIKNQMWHLNKKLFNIL
jgi:hypothetical protein